MEDDCEPALGLYWCTVWRLESRNEWYKNEDCSTRPTNKHSKLTQAKDFSLEQYNEIIDIFGEVSTQVRLQHGQVGDTALLIRLLSLLLQTSKPKFESSTWNHYSPFSPKIRVPTAKRHNIEIVFHISGALNTDTWSMWYSVRREH